MGVIERRRFLYAAGGFAITPLFAFGQQQSAKVARVGFLGAASADGAYTQRVEAFRAGLRDLGYVEGKSIVIEFRWADGRYERLPDLARELLRLNVDVIVAVPSPAIRAAQQATSAVPIVFPTTGDPVGSGFAKSLGHPGGNLTGLSNTHLDLSPKLLEMLKIILPKLSHIAVLANPGSTTEAAVLKSMQAAGQKVGVQILPVEVRSQAELERGFSEMVRARIGAVVVTGDGLLISQMPRIAELALIHHIPSIASLPWYAEVGGLISYGQDTVEGFRRAASYVDKILKGANPGDLPIEQPTQFQLIINRKTARALKLAVPKDLLFRADRVIE
jgi:putative ABC transport system substrate-binding protein